MALSGAKDKHNPGTPDSFAAWEKRLGKPSSGVPDILEKWTHARFYQLGGLGIAGVAALFFQYGIAVEPGIAGSIVAGYWAVGINDMRQVHQTIRRNFPVLGHFRYLLESLRPEVRQYFIEDDQVAKPFSREQRSMVYQRAKGMADTQAFGTRRDVYEEGYEWASHSMWSTHVRDEFKRKSIGNAACKQPYDACRLNVSAMSYGAISSNAILALNAAAQMGNFYQNTGEGGISRYHLQNGGDIVWNIGTGYFGCRDRATGGFDAAQFVDRVSNPAVKMVELKLSQGAKPAHGGMLPGAKVTEAIAEARGIPVGQPSNSPPRHSEFSDARGMLVFVDKLRELSGGKPVGIKFCMGKPVEIAVMVGAMREMGVYPDFITVDGAEGGTGAAPPEFSNHLGFPLQDALAFVNNVLVGADVRDEVTLICSGKVLSGFSMVRAMALGADVCNAARAMMFALGCIQALKCQTNHCPTGITTQIPELVNGLDVHSKSFRVKNFHESTLHNFHEIVGAMGLEDPAGIRPEHVMRRLAGGTYSMSYADIFPQLRRGALIRGEASELNSNVQAFWDEGQKTLRGERSQSIAFQHNHTVPRAPRP